MTDSPAIELHGITKKFQHVEALRGADFDVYPGEIVGLIGDNGAGKSTLVKVMAGVFQPDGGEIKVGGSSAVLSSPNVARDLGIHVVFQELGLAPDLNAFQNLYLGRELIRPGFIGRTLGLLDKAKMSKLASDALERHGLAISNPEQPVNTLSGGQRQRVAIVNSVLSKGSVIIMDEPTAALGVEARRSVVKLILQIRDAGAAVVVISHDLPDLITVADRFHVMRLGRRAAVLEKNEATLEGLVDVMAGVTAR